MEYLPNATNLSAEESENEDEDKESIGSDFEEMLEVAIPIDDPAYEKALRHMMALKHHAEDEKKVLRQQAAHIKARDAKH